MQDLRIGIRSLMRVPMLTLTIIVTVGIGIGATAAIFSAIDAAMLRPLPYAEPRSAGAHLHRHAAVQVPFLRRRLPRIHGTADAIRAVRDLHRSRGQLQQRRHRRAVAHARGVVGLLLAARRLAGDRPRLHRSRRTAGHAAGGAGESRVLAAAARRARRRARQADPARRRRLHPGRRRAARQWPARSPLRPVPDPAVRAAAAQGPVLLLGDRAIAEGRGSHRSRPTSCARSIARCFRSGSRPTRTRNRRGAWRI